ncbi:MAG: GNAT family N-acetyltransferase [Rhodobacteraceae bacterium]|nr:GNAT family N-acetyltransferase [Paracoccaceae bacterium]
MEPFQRGRYRVRLSETAADLDTALALRGRCFRGGGGQSDRDAFDDLCAHILVEDAASGALVCCFRLLPLRDAQSISGSYAAQFYDLDGLRSFEGPMIEMGRFCIAPECRDPDILRLAWAALGRMVDEMGAELLFGCSSFQGTEAEAYHDAFALLKDRHVAPRRWRPRVKAPSVFRFAQKLSALRPDVKRAMRSMPPLLRSYLSLGGWVSDHAVVDRDLGTLHVFTGLEIRAIPPARARLLRTLSN